MSVGTSERRVAASASRNEGPILEVLGRFLPSTGRALEIASGTGQHVAAFAAAFPGVRWTPSDRDPGAHRSIAAWIAEGGARNVAAPLALDVEVPDWAAALDPGVDAVIAVNLLHISPWSATLGLLDGAGRLLVPGGLLILYGPFVRAGVHTAPSNAAFDAALRERDPRWGVRSLESIESEARTRGLLRRAVCPMPANNLVLVFALQLGLDPANFSLQ